MLPMIGGGLLCVDCILLAAWRWGPLSLLDGSDFVNGVDFAVGAGYLESCMPPPGERRWWELAQPAGRGCTVQQQPLALPWEGPTFSTHGT